MVYGPPTPAVDGLKLVPVTPVPLKVPPAGFPDNGMEAAFTQTDEAIGLMETTGSAFTVIVVVAVPVQPFPFVYVYVIV